MSPITLLRPSQRASSAEIRTSACRGYVVELDPENSGEPRMLENIFGRVVHFRSLDRVRQSLLRRGVRDARLVQPLACEETSALGVSTRGEAGVPVLKPTAEAVR
jgi:hypothetical protein